MTTGGGKGLMITKKNMDRGIILFELFTNDFQTFEKEIDKLKPKDKEQISWWWKQCSNYLESNKSLERFMK